MYAETYILLCNNISKERSRHLFGSVWAAYTLTNIQTHTHTLSLFGETVGKLLRSYFRLVSLSFTWSRNALFTHSRRKKKTKNSWNIVTNTEKVPILWKTSRITHVFFSSLYYHYHYVARRKSHVGSFHILRKRKKRFKNNN